MITVKVMDLIIGIICYKNQKHLNQFTMSLF